MSNVTVNYTDSNFFKNLGLDENKIWMLISLFTCLSWVIYIIFYNSRVVGLIISKLLNKWFVKGAYFKIGSLSLNPLAGKIMFRDIVYISFDYSVRIQDGYIIFRWWRSYVPKNVSEDLSHSDTRLSVQLNGFEIHTYNRSNLYSHLEKIFSLPSAILMPTENFSSEEKAKIEEVMLNMENTRKSSHQIKKKERPEAMTATTWRDLIPVIKIDICTGRFVFGNRLTPTTLSISLEEAHCTYSTKPAVCKLDHFMHFVKAKVENAKVMFAPSPKYTGLVDEPPRYMGEGFVVMMSNIVELYFYMDDAGVVPDEPVLITLANGDVVEPAPPVWGLDIKCGKGTDFSYGPWADRQRDHLFKFFFPSDWQKMKPTPTPKAGELRMYQSFDITLCTLNEATIDILFSKDKETNAMHVTIGPGSYVEVTIPWVTQNNGYTTAVAGQLLHAEATTSLQYRSLAEFESLEYKVKIHYPCKWNDSQDWTINLTGCKATAFLVYKHKSFFQDLIEDWSSKARPDILTFIPYVCKFTILLKDFELITLSNEYNWIDCSSTNQENNHIAFCGDLFDLSFSLPFDDFLPEKVPIKFWIHGEGLDLKLYLPEVSSSRPIVIAIDQNCKILTRSGKIKKRLDLYPRKWQRVCQRSVGWVDFWSAPIVAISILYVYHPMPPVGPQAQADITTPEKEEILLSPIRIPKLKKSPVMNWAMSDSFKFDPTTLPADEVTVEIEIGSSVLLAYGSVLRNFIHLKENIFGDDQNFFDMEQSNANVKTASGMEYNNKDISILKDGQNKNSCNVIVTDEKQKCFDPRYYRPLEVIVSLTIHDIQAHLVKNCTETDPPCPVILIERLGFEMKKRYTETELQVLVSPSYLISLDNLIRPNQEKHIKQGHIMMSALQIRGHAMFSNEGRSLDDETLEYAWLLEIQIGKIQAKLTAAQLLQVVSGLETFVILTVDPENCVKSPKTEQLCYHGNVNKTCPKIKSLVKYKCPSSEEIKYKMTRVAVDVIDFYLIESGTALHTWVSPVRLSMCNLHGQKVKLGVTGLFPYVLLRLFLQNNKNYSQSSHNGRKSSKTINIYEPADDDANSTEFKRRRDSSLRNNKKTKESFNSRNGKDDISDKNINLEDTSQGFSADHWIEVGYSSFGPILFEGASALPFPDHKLHELQHNFLKEHDQRLKKLWFLWNGFNGSKPNSMRCGCIGGCAFFGANRNGPKFFKPSSQDIKDNYNVSRFHILNKSKEFGFGESILHKGKLVFHTPPYSLRTVVLCDSNEPNNFEVFQDQKYCLSEIDPHKKTVQINSKRSREPSVSSTTSVGKYNTVLGTANKQNQYEVPYSRLLESPSKKITRKDWQTSTSHSTLATKAPDGIQYSVPKTSASDSKLTCEIDFSEDLEVPNIMSHSAPQTNPLHFESPQLNGNIGDDFEKPNLPFTASITSDCPSEIFFSAEEDIQSNIHAGTNTFNSPIEPFSHNMYSSRPYYATCKSDTEFKRRDSKHNYNRISGSNIELINAHAANSSESPSFSTNSFISAMSSQEDVALSNSHIQMNRSIFESQLLMESYLSHLALLTCNNWNSCSFPFGADALSLPLYYENESGELTYIGSKMFPKFELLSNWKEIKMLPKVDLNYDTMYQQNMNEGLKPHPWDPSVMLSKTNEDCDGEDSEFLDFQGESVASCVSIVMRMKGQCNVLITPLLLEGIQRIIETVIPSISSMHPLTIINSMHYSCMNRVQNDNILKSDESLSYWSQLNSNQKGADNIQQTPRDSILSDVYKESITSKIQGLFIIPKVSVNMLQASVVSERTSLTKLDNIQELSCVSLLAFYIQGISAKFHLAKTNKASMQNIYIQKSVKSENQTKKSGIMRGTKAFLAQLSSQARPDNIAGEPILIETSEKQLEELVIALDVASTHIQLRRLKNELNKNQNAQAIITAIPEYKSKTSFSCVKMPEGQDDDIGFIMFECGLERLSVKMIKKSHYEKSDNTNDHKNVADKANAKNFANAQNAGNMNAASETESSNMNLKTDFAWRILQKKPPTPKTPKERISHALEQIIVMGDDDSKSKQQPKVANENDTETDDSKNTTQENEKTEAPANQNDKISSCVIELKSIWFNFAAPPCVPITKKIDFTRLDWNLLSTASPAITAWMNPSNRLTMKIISLSRSLHTRYTAVAACLMADALDNEKFQRKQKMKKSRYPNMYTLLSKTLQEDPSCQLSTIMQKFMLDEGGKNFESNFKQSDIPHLNVLRQGVIVLCRQWKNMLYNPILFEHQYKNKLFRSDVTLAFDQIDEENEDGECDGDNENLEIVNPIEILEETENTLLLGHEKLKFGTPEPGKTSTETLTSPNLHGLRRNIQMIPIISGLVDKQHAEIEYGALQDDSTSSLNSLNKMLYSDNQKEDIYTWMAKQQENFHRKEFSRPPTRKSNTPVESHEYKQDSIKLLDAHLIFEPLLTCLGVMPQQMINKVNATDISTLENFGTNVSLIGTFDSIRVDIVVSEMGENNQSKNKGGHKKGAKKPVNIDAPSFLCEKVGIDLEVYKISDGRIIQAKPYIYISRRQLKKHASTIVNFSLNIRFISQQVNMPLLRLLNQISNMYQNVKDAQTKFHEQPELAIYRKNNVKTDVTIDADMYDCPYYMTAAQPDNSRIFGNDKVYDSNIFARINNRSSQQHITRSFLLQHQHTPSPQVKPRPQSFAQKLRSTGKSVKGKLGYTNLNESKISPLQEHPENYNISKLSLESRGFNPEHVPIHNTNIGTGIIYQSVQIPNCWKKIYHLLELYGSMPDNRRIHRTSISTDVFENGKNPKGTNRVHVKTDEESNSVTALNLKKGQLPEKTRIAIFGVAKIHKTRLLATLSGLKLEAEITTFNSSFTWRKKTRPIPSLECSLTGQVGRAMIVLLEGVNPNQQTVVKIIIGKSQTLYSSVTKKGKDKNSGLLSVGPVNIDIPQHPVALHGMMTRSSKQLSSTLQELRVGRNSSRSSYKGPDEPESPFRAAPDTKEKIHPKGFYHVSKSASNQNTLLQPLVMQFNILLQSLSINAALLPSLQAQYKMNHVNSNGITGSKARFSIDLPTHTLSFSTKFQSLETNLPAEACIALPPIHVAAEYIPESQSEDMEMDGIVLRKGSYVKAQCDIGEFERCLTTDLLNHLVFVQKVFMKEVNEVIQKVYGGEKPVPIWLEDTHSYQVSSFKTILFSLNISMKRIQLTATTPCSSAVRFETGTLELHLSNRVKNVGEGHERKLFGKAHINFNLSLGQIIKNIIFDEAEPEYQQYAFFHTTIALRNAFQDELLREDKELILLTLKRPLIYIQPVAVDKAILVWLNYKNAYEYWAEKRANLSYDLPVHDQNAYEKAAFEQLGNIAVSNLSMLFLQLTIEDLGLCLPLNPESWTSRSYQDFEAKGAVVITLEDIIISACNSGSLVSTGKFSGLCLRFADDFETTLDDWKPNVNETCIMNLCVVSEGTCEVCSRTIATKKNENAKWFLNVKWQMEGVDIHLDTNIGKHLSSLGHTLTTLSGFEDDDLNTVESPDSENTDSNVQQKKHDLENLPAFLFDPRIDSKKRSIMMEREMAEQLKIINDLRTLGASHNTISHEERRLQELQALCYKYFRRDIIQKWKRPSIRYSMINTSNKQKSFASPTTIADIEEHCLDKKLEQSELSDLPTSLRSDNWNNSLRSTKSTGRPTLSAALRQTSLPNTNIDSELIENDIIWVSSDDLTNNIVTPPDIKKKSQQKEPSIDFELDVKVLVNSGKCVLHTKERNEDKYSSTSVNIKYHKRERSLGNDWNSPLPSRKRDKSKLRYTNPFPLDLTIFHIPGLDVKLQYQSTTIHTDDLSYLMQDNFDFSTVPNRRVGNKRAFLSAWIQLQSIPEETTISPHILQFLEETLEPISTKSDNNITSASNGMNIDLLPDNYVVYASFPVDVIVYFHMRPSTFRFSCLPVSRVECMLQLPSLDIVFSSKRQDDNDLANSLEKNASGGLSVTGCLADFNVYIFHPYGGKKSGYKDAKLYPLNDAERKNSLSINVEFVKFHLNRRRKQYNEHMLTKRLGNDSLSRAVIRFSTIVDIGSASFKYDMRRLTEILAFPKAWYRRRIMRRLFLGDLSGQTDVKPKVFKPDASEQFNGVANSVVPVASDKINLRMTQFDSGKIFLKPKNDSEIVSSEPNQAAAWETLVLFVVNFTKLNVQMNMGNVMGNVVWLTRDFQSDGRLNIMSSGYKNMRIGIHLGGSSLDAKGGIVGGNFELSQIDKQIRIKEQGGSEPNHTMGLNLKALELRLDYMGTSVLMTRISSFSISMRDEWKTSETIRKLTKNAIIFTHSDISWDQLQIMISKSTTADILKMYNKLEEFFSQQFKSSKRVFSILESKGNDRNGSLKRKMRKREKQASENGTDLNSSNAEGKHHRHWQKPLSLSKGLKLLSLPSTLLERENVLGGTVELRGSNISLACFHGINFKSKCWALFSLKEPCINYVTEARLVNETSDIKATQSLTFNLGETNKTPQNHSMAIVSRITRNVIFPPQFKNLNEWFQYAFANSEIDAVDRFPILEKEKEIATNSIERVRTASSIPLKAQDHNHNREVIFALPSLQCHFKTEHRQGASIPLLNDEKPIVLCSFITEFDDHIFVTVDADAFFFLHDLISSYVKEKEKVIEAQNAKTTSPNISQVSKHSNGSAVLNGNGTTMNTTLQSQSSIEEIKTAKQSSPQQTAEKKSEQTLDLEAFVRDFRHFECKTWHLEPTVRLLSWAGKSIEPYGIDYILNKLGFSHARTTIPKWMQRGFMDPFDKVQALLMTQLLAIVKENKPNNEQN